MTSPPRNDARSPPSPGGGGRATPAPLSLSLVRLGLPAASDWPARPPITGERGNPAQLGLGPFPINPVRSGRRGRDGSRREAAPRWASFPGGLAPCRFAAEAVRGGERSGLGPTWTVPAPRGRVPSGGGGGDGVAALRGLSRFWREALRRRGRVGGCCCCCRVSWSPRLRWLWRPPCSLAGATVATHLGAGRGEVGGARPRLDGAGEPLGATPVHNRRALPPPWRRLVPGCLALPLAAFRHSPKRLGRSPAYLAGRASREGGLGQNGSWQFLIGGWACQ